MNITRNIIDNLNAVVTVEISKEDYTPKVEKVLANYRKTANIPGFRKGAVPVSLIKKQYGKAVLLEEVNKLLQENLNEFLQKEKLDLLGNPLPVIKDDFNWDADTLTFDFELGLSPDFEIDFGTVKNLNRYKI